MFTIQIQVNGEPNPSQPKELQHAALEWAVEKYPYAREVSAIVLIPAYVPDLEARDPEAEKE